MRTNAALSAPSGAMKMVRGAHSAKLSVLGFPISVLSPPGDKRNAQSNCGKSSRNAAATASVWRSMLCCRPRREEGGREELDVGSSYWGSVEKQVGWERMAGFVVRSCFPSAAGAYGCRRLGLPRRAGPVECSVVEFSSRTALAAVSLPDSVHLRSRGEIT